ncbi:MAG TPA: hypothetical protein VJU79_02705 [Candidatus Dormibacteraeota bacterium]|nr:hypothetical protein [Candidatus Dormibacteraeota bacterium]
MANALWSLKAQLLMRMNEAAGSPQERSDVEILAAVRRLTEEDYI